MNGSTFTNKEKKNKHNNNNKTTKKREREKKVREACVKNAETGDAPHESREKAQKGSVTFSSSLYLQLTSYF